MKFFYFIFLFGIFMLPANAQAQGVNNNFGSYSSSSSDLSQEAIVTQLGTNSGNLGSQVMLIQNGSNNASYIKVYGEDNLVASFQDGERNNLAVALIGNENNYQLKQTGDDNNLDLDQVRSKNIDFQVNQISNNNELIIKGNSTGELPALKIEQSGGMRLTIQSNTFFVP